MNAINEWLLDFYWPNAWWLDPLGLILLMLLFVVALLVMIAFLLYFDRKVWAAVQMRRGPNVVGPYGVLQTFADFFKFVFKEIVVPAGANKGVYFIAPFLSLTLALGAWSVIPVADRWVFADINVGILYIMAISSLGVYGIIMGGWASNSKYPFLSALRSAAQMVSYEVSIGFVIITILLTAGSLNLSKIVEAQAGGIHHWYLFSHLLPMAVIFFISALAETNRPPFDLTEAESELVAGFMVEYSSTPYLLFMIAEYVSIVLMCALMTILFLGGWHPPIDVAPLTWVPGVIWFVIKIWVIFFLFAMVKAIVPRYRYDQLMRIGWKFFLPISLLWVVLTAGYLLAFDKLP
jgi:NADH-quinone oxidoreductase subunit H